MDYFQVIPISNQQISNGVMFPLALAPLPGSDKSFDSLVKAIKKHRKHILTTTFQHGALLLRGWTNDSPEGFADVSEALNLEKYPYVGGAAPRTNVVRDVVFTTNESPPEKPIPFHHEISQVPNPPSYIMFYCNVEPSQGGHTPIIQSAEVCDYLFRKYPEFAKELESKGVKYIRVMPKETDNDSPIGRSWKETFQCETKVDAERAMSKIGSTWEWLSNGDVRVTSAVVPALYVVHFYF